MTAIAIEDGEWSWAPDPEPQKQPPNNGGCFICAVMGGIVLGMWAACVVGCFSR